MTGSTEVAAALRGLDADKLSRLPADARSRLAKALTPRFPAEFGPRQGLTPKQTAALLLPHREVFYGGAAGGGKSYWLLLGALQYADVPGYAALLLRRTFAELKKADGLIAKSFELLAGTAAKWNGSDYRWTFPSGAVIEFGHMQHEHDRHQYQSAAYQFIGFDELTHFTETQYRYMFSRLRRPKQGNPVLGSVPLRIRSASNPGASGHEWVKARFVDPGDSSRPFIPAVSGDNPFLDQEEYRASLAELPPVMRRQLEDGDWTARQEGSMFRRERARIVDALPVDAKPHGCRWWDLAATEPSEGSDPDWTVGARLHRTAEGLVIVSDVQRFRLGPGERDRRIRQTAELDGRDLPIWIEQEPGSSGKSQVHYFVTQLLAGWNVHGEPATGDKVVNAAPFASQWDAGNVALVRGPWNGDYLDELEAFPAGAHDDQVDASSKAFKKLTQHPGFAVV